MQAQVHRRGLARGREHAAVVDVEHVRVDRHPGIARGQLLGVGPVRGRAQPVQQAGGGQHERARAQRDHPRARLVGRAHRLDQVGRRVLVDVRQGGDDHGAGARQPVEPAVRLQQEPADPHRRACRRPRRRTRGRARRPGRSRRPRRPGPARSAASRRWRRQRDRAHVRNCTGRVVPDTGTGGPTRTGSPQWITSSTREQAWDRVRTWRCSAPTGTPGGSWSRSCGSADIVPLLLGRDAGQAAGAGPGTGLEARQASVDDPASLDRALDGAAAVINCAGPFATTAAPLIEAALRAGIPYVDVAAEIEANRRHVRALRRARPRRGHRGGPGDGLLRRPRRPAGHHRDGRLDGGRRGAHRLRPEQLAPHRPERSPRARSRGSDAVAAVSATPAAGWSTTTTPCRPWSGPSRPRSAPRACIGEFTMADVVTVPSHLAVPEVRTYMTANAAADLSAPDASAPAAVDERGRSAQTFVVDVLVRSGGTERRVVAARPGHLRHQRAARGGGRRPHPHRPDQDHRRRLRGRDLRRPGLPPRPVLAPLARHTRGCFRPLGGHLTGG